MSPARARSARLAPLLVTLLALFALVLCSACEAILGLPASKDAPGDDAGDAGGDGATLEAAPPSDATCPADARDYYVTGDVPCAFPTITAALAAARQHPGFPRAIHVPAGTYTAPSETFPFDLRGGVSLVGASAAATRIVGAGPINRAIEGGGIGAAHLRGTLIVGDTAIASEIRNVTVSSNLPDKGAPGGVALDAFAILCDRGIAPTGATSTPGLVVDGVIVGRNYGVGIGVATSSSPKSGCTARVTSTTFQAGSWLGIQVGGCDGSASPARVALEVGDGTDKGKNAFENLGDYTSQYGGMYVADCVSALTVHGNDFIRGEAGIIFDQPADDGTVSVTGNHFFMQSSGGIRVKRGGTIAELSSNKFEQCDTAGVFLEDSAAHITRARSNVFVGNKRGIVVFRDTGLAGELDFGRPGDPGLNELRCNSDLNGGDGFDVGTFAPVVMKLYGNYWDHKPPTQLATEENGRDVAVRTDATIDVGDPRSATTPCPSTHTAGP
jgi:hypothetical protein